MIFFPIRKTIDMSLLVNSCVFSVNDSMVIKKYCTLPTHKTAPPQNICNHQIFYFLILNFVKLALKITL